MSENLSACAASSGISSLIRIPATRVAAGLVSGPQTSLPASGFGSNVSTCEGPPAIQISITDFAFGVGLGVVGGAARAARTPLAIGAAKAPTAAALRAVRRENRRAPLESPIGPSRSRRQWRNWNSFVLTSAQPSSSADSLGERRSSRKCSIAARTSPRVGSRDRSVT